MRNLGGNVDMSVFERIKFLANSRSITLRKVTDDLGFSENYLYGFKNSDRKPSAKNLQSIADYFGVSIDYLLGREENATQQSIDLDKALDEAMSFNGKPLSEHDRKVVRDLVEAYLNNQK